MLTGTPAAAIDNVAPAKPKRRKLSAAVRARMKAAQQLRWAKVKGTATVGTNSSRPNELGLPDLIKPVDFVRPDHSDNVGLLSEVY